MSPISLSAYEKFAIYWNLVGLILVLQCNCGVTVNSFCCLLSSSACVIFFFMAFSPIYCISFMFGFCHDSRADEEPVDQKRYLEESCKPKCVKPLLEYQVCFFEVWKYKLDNLKMRFILNLNTRFFYFLV